MSEVMKVAVLTGPKMVEFVERPIPKPAPGEVLIRVMHVGVCGSDLHFYEDGRLGNWIPDGPLVLGHEPGGQVVALGEGVKNLKVGDMVAVEPGVPCHMCEFCMKGSYHLCDTMSFMSIPFERDGGFQEYITHPANMCFKLPDNMDTMEGALIEPLCVALHSIFLSEAKAGQSAIVLGCGCIGLCCIMALKACGITEIYAADVLDKRLEKAKELGATRVFRADKEDIVAFCSTLPGGGVDQVYEAAGNPVTTLQTAKLVRKGGTVTLVGMAPNPELTLDIGTLSAKEANLETVYRYRNLYPTAIKAVSGGTVPLKSIASHVYDFKDTIKALKYNVENKHDVIKAVISFQ